MKNDLIVSVLAVGVIAAILWSLGYRPPTTFTLPK